MDTLLSYLQVNFLQQGPKVFSYFIRDGVTTPITFDQLFRESSRYAHRFQSLGIGAGDNILIVLQHCPDLLYAFVGALLNRSIPAILPFPSVKQDRQSYWQTLKELFLRINTRAVITYARNRPELESCIQSTALHILTPDEMASGANDVRPSVFDFAAPSPDDIAFLQHTSGTTGLKKSIALSHRAVVNQIETYATVLRVTSADVIVSWLPLYHDMGLIACFLLPLLRGLTVAMMDPFEWVYQPGMLFDAIATYQGTLAWLPNFSFHHLAQTLDSPTSCDTSSLRALISCSEPCKPAAFRQLSAAFPAGQIKPELLQTCYAMAENVFAVTQSELGKPVTVLAVDRQAYYADNRVVPQADPRKAVEFLSVGSVVPGVSIKIVDSARREVAENVIGEVAIRGSSLFSGYYQLPELTEQVMSDGWYFSGDLGFLSTGELYITGRLKDIIIVNGKNYYAHDIEAIVNQLPAIKKGRVAAIGQFNDALGSEEIIVIAEATDWDPAGQLLLKKQAKALLMREMDLYIRDLYLVPPGWIVKTTSGKVSRAENKQKYLREIAQVRTDRIPA